MHTLHPLLRAATATLALTLPLLAPMTAQAGLSSPAADSTEATGTPPGYNATCRCYRNVSYGSVTWLEPTTRKFARQEMDIWMPDAAVHTGLRPVVYYGHANAATHTIAYDKAPESMYSRFVKPLTDAGYIVVSYEFRHPVVNYVSGLKAPRLDIQKAINYFVANHAAALKADPTNTFITGRSRGGGLGLLTALTGKFSGGTTVRAVRTFQAQTTFDCQESARTFVIESDRDAFLAECTAVPGAGSSLQSVTSAAPPVYVGYDRPFRHQLVPASEVDVHHPDFGLALCDRYNVTEAPAQCVPVEAVAELDEWKGVVDYFNAYRVAR